jgi:uncharacterized protein (TIGR03067 family)
MALTVGAPGKEPPAKDSPSIVGEWVTFIFAADGKLTIKEGKRDKNDTGTYKTDAKKDPAEIDIIPPEDKKDPTVQGIYKLDGDTLTLAFGRGKEKSRPTKFESPEGTDTIVITLKRAKK